MKKILYSVLLVMFCSCMAGAKDLVKIDSLLNILPQASPEMKFNIYMALSHEYETLTMSDDALKAAQSALMQSYQADNGKNSVEALYRTGLIYYRKNEYDKAIDNFIQALKLGDEIKYENRVPDILTGIGSVYRLRGNNDKAQIYNFKALDVAKKSKNQELETRILTNIGNSYYDESDYKNALKYYNTALTGARKINDKANEATILNSLAATYSVQNNYDHAIQTYKETYAIFEKLNDRYNVANNLSNIGINYLNLKQMPAAVDYLKQSLEVANTINAKEIKLVVYDNLAYIFEEQNNYKDALMYTQLYMDLNDTLHSNVIDKNIDELVIKYEADVKEKENKQLKKEQIAAQNLNLIQQKRQIYLSIGLILAIAAGIVLYSISRARRLANIQLQELIDQKIAEAYALRSTGSNTDDKADKI